MLPPGLAYSEGILHGTPKSAITGYPWKIICEPETNKETFFNLEQDPGEQHDLAGEKPQAYVSFSEMLLRILYTVTDSWYIELADDGKGHKFDIDVVTESGPLTGSIYLYHFMDEAGHFLPADAVAPAASAASKLAFANLSATGGRLTLAFKVEGPPSLPVTFDVRLDGRPARERTFVGEALKNPAKLPFALRSGHMGHKTWGAPEQRPAPPYLLVWRVQGTEAAATPAALTDDAKRELRALGYIQ
jgi:hypothetical protein